MFDTPAIVAHMRDLLLKPRHFGIGLIECALTGMQRIARFVMFTAQFFEALFRLAQTRGFGFEFDTTAFDFPCVARPCGYGFFLACKPQQIL